MKRIAIALTAALPALAVCWSGSSTSYASPAPGLAAKNPAWAATSIPQATLEVPRKGACVSALSSDGRVAVVADLRGVYLFRASSGSWDSSPKPAATLGVPHSALVNLTAVATSWDGTTVLVAAGAVGDDPAAVYVFHVSSPRAWQSRIAPTAILTNADDPTGFGSSVALSADGETALVGEPGGADVFQVSAADSWRDSSNPTATLVADPGGAARGGITTVVALSADGTTALIGATSLETFVGAAYVFRAPADAWVSNTTPDAVLTDGAAGLLGDGFGGSVALSPDGTTALVGAANLAVGPAGAAYLFEVGSPDAWISTADPDAVVDRTPIKNSRGAVPGWSVALSEDRTALVGAPSVLRGHGSADVFQLAAPSHTVSRARLTNAASPPGDLFGAAVGVSADGAIALVSSVRAASIYTRARSRGAAYCYVPYVKGKALPAARRAIESTHCRAGKVTRISATRVRGARVVSQTPGPGVRLAKGAKVALKMSKGLSH